MSDQRGVSLDVLRCPTCGQPFHHDVQHDRPGFVPLGSIDDPTPRYIAPEPEPPYLVCWERHAWTLKLLIRFEGGAPDEVLLDQYIGER